MSDFSRRALLGTGIAGGIGMLFGLPRVAMGSANQRKRPKNIIFCVADGMAISAPTCADIFQQITGQGKGYWAGLTSDPEFVVGLQDTRSLGSIVTDSSAASSAWGSGRHIWNGQVNVFPDGTKLRTLGNIVQEHGMKVGLVTTTTATHATPSGFLIQLENRDREWDIASQHLTTQVDVLMGGGNKFFAGDKRQDKKDLYSDFVAKGYQVARTRDEMLRAPKGKRLLGIFTEGHLPYSVDRNHSSDLQKAVPTLAEMVATAIDHLKGGKEGFLLQVEGGRVDHGGHSNDAAAWLYDQIAFEEAVKVAIEFAKTDGETLVVMTSDHACGGPALNGAGWEYFDSTAGLKKFAEAQCSFEGLDKLMGKSPTADVIRATIQDQLKIELKPEEAAAIEAAGSGKSPLKVVQFLAGQKATLSQILGNYTKLSFTSGNHTNDHVLVTAFGPGAHLFHGLNANTSFFDKILSLRGIEFKNPTMSYDDAKRHYDSRKPQADIEQYAWYLADEDECCALSHRGLVGAR